MNKNQKNVLIIVAVFLFLMLLFPPWHEQRSGMTLHTAYSLIFHSPGLFYSINIGMLFMQFLFTITIGGIFYFILKDKNGEKRSDKTEEDNKLSKNSEKENI
jgi:preprotein translocase subunit YajC